MNADQHGLPEHADPDSRAADTGLDQDRVDPVAPPPQPEDGSLGLEGFGTTPAEQRSGEPLDGRLARERPDVDPDADDGSMADPDVDPYPPTLQDTRDIGRAPRPNAAAEEAAMHIDEG